MRIGDMVIVSTSAKPTMAPKVPPSRPEIAKVRMANEQPETESERHAR